MNKYVCVGNVFDTKAQEIQSFVIASPEFKADKAVVDRIVSDAVKSHRIVLWIAAIDICKTGDTFASLDEKLHTCQDAYMLLSISGLSPRDCIYVNATYACGSWLYGKDRVGVLCSPAILANVLFQQAATKGATYVVFDNQAGVLHCAAIYNAYGNDEKREIQFSEVCEIGKCPKKNSAMIIKTPKAVFEDRERKSRWVRNMTKELEESFGFRLVLYPLPVKGEKQ